MSATSVFQYSNYLGFILSNLKENRHRHGYKTRLASAAGCQRAYFSQVLNGNANLTLDHGIGLCDFWGFGELEKEYFLQLINLEKAATPMLKNHVGKQIADIKNRYENLSQRFQKRQLIDPEEKQKYYSSWVYSAIHILVSIPEFQTEKEISRKLGLDEPIVTQVLNKLNTMGLVQKEQSLWKLKAADIHTGKDVALTTMYHTHWRNKGILDSQNENSDGIHYTAIHSMSRDDYQKIKNLLLEILDESRKTVASSKEEVLVAFTLDFFGV